MKLLLDANVSWRLVSILKDNFGECIHADDISELEFPAKNTQIWQYARDNGYTIVTHDNDFNDLISVRGFPPKIIWLRIGNCPRKITANLLILSKQAIEELLESAECGLLEIF